MKVHHIGYYVDNINNAIENFLDLGWEITGESKFDKNRKVKIVFLKMGGNCIELIEPLEGCKTFTKNMRKLGNFPYHICYQVDDIAKAGNELVKKGYTVLRECEEAPALDGGKVLFLYSLGTGQIELVEF